MSYVWVYFPYVIDSMWFFPWTWRFGFAHKKRYKIARNHARSRRRVWQDQRGRDKGERGGHEIRSPHFLMGRFETGRRGGADVENWKPATGYGTSKVVKYYVHVRLWTQVRALLYNIFFILRKLNACLTYIDILFIIYQIHRFSRMLHIINVSIFSDLDPEKYYEKHKIVYVFFNESNVCDSLHL